MLHRLLGKVVGLWKAVQGQALVGADGVLREQSCQDGFHHHHGDMLADAGTRARAEWLEVTARRLEEEKQYVEEEEGAGSWLKPLSSYKELQNFKAAVFHSGGVIVII